MFVSGARDKRQASCFYSKFLTCYQGSDNYALENGKPVVGFQNEICILKKSLWYSMWNTLWEARGEAGHPGSRGCCFTTEGEQQ